MGALKDELAHSSFSLIDAGLIDGFVGALSERRTNSIRVDNVEYELRIVLASVHLKSQ